jgi:probable phosphoglycerate mutase
MRDRPELLLLRHGETLWNREGRLQGARDSELTERGREQARRLGRLLRGLGVSAATHGALASPQGRARETARLVLEPLGLRAQEDARLAEIRMGDWTGLLRAEVEDRWPGPEGEGVLAFYGRCPGGERLEEVAARAAAVLAEVRHPTVIVTHGFTMRVLCALALGRGPGEAEGIVVPQGSLARVAGGRIDVIAPGPDGLHADAGAASPGDAGG